MSGAGQVRQINGILSLLIREHYPGMVTVAGTNGNMTMPPWMWDHFALATNNVAGTKAAWIKQEHWVSLHRTTLVNLLYSLVVLKIMK